MICGHGYQRRVDCRTCASIDAQNRRDFAWALTQLREGRAVRRRAWERSPIDFVFLVRAWECPAIAQIDREYRTAGAPFIAQSREDVAGPLPWTPSSDDLTAEDWRVIGAPR